MLKKEFQVDNGSFIALSSKCYHLLDRTTLFEKKALKGIHSDSVITHQDFYNCLYHNETVTRNQVRFHYNKKLDMMTLINQNKKALNSIYTKMCVKNDFVSIEPLKLNGKFL